MATPIHHSLQVAGVAALRALAARALASRILTRTPAALLCGALAAGALAGCSRDDAAQRSDSAATAAALVIAPPPGPYREVPLRAVGRIRGRVRAEPVPGDVPGVTVAPGVAVAPAAAREAGPACEDAAADGAPAGIDGGLPGAVVWLRDARQGKPLPLERRYALTNRRCRLEPRVQAAIAGGTLNIRNLDPIEHRTRLVRQGSVDIVSVVRQYDEGQVVPDEQVLERPALVHATCELHPWSEAWVAVFDHPYFAVTTPDGAFVIDSVPPGTYRLVVWHERGGKAEREVEVTAGESLVELKLD